MTYGTTPGSSPSSAAAGAPGAAVESRAPPQAPSPAACALSTHPPVPRAGAVEQSPGGAIDLATQRRLQQYAVVGDGPVADGELERRHRQLVADGKARRARPAPFDRQPQPPRRLGRELEPRLRPEAEVAQQPALLGGCESGREPGHRDVAGDP